MYQENTYITPKYIIIIFGYDKYIRETKREMLMNKEIREIFFDNIYVNPKYIEAIHPVHKRDENFTYYFMVYMVAGDENDSYISREFQTEEEANKNRDLLIDYITEINEY